MISLTYHEMVLPQDHFSSITSCPSWTPRTTFPALAVFVTGFWLFIFNLVYSTPLPCSLDSSFAFTSKASALKIGGWAVGYSSLGF